MNKLAFGGDRLAILNQENTLLVVSLAADGDIGEIICTRSLDWVPRRLTVSSSGRYVLLHGGKGETSVVYDTFKYRPRAIPKLVSRGAYPVTAAFARGCDGEVVLFSRGISDLGVCFLPDVEMAFVPDERRTVAFTFTHLYPTLKDEDTFFAIGHLFSEMKDSLVTFSLKNLLMNELAAEQHILDRHRIHDYTYRLAIGPCGHDQIVVFRDPEGDEEPGDDGEYSHPLRDVENFCGLYIRRVSDGALAERVEYDAPIQTGALVLGTDKAIVIGCSDHLDIVPRHGLAPDRATVSGRILNLDWENRRVALLDERERLKIFMPPGV